MINYFNYRNYNLNYYRKLGFLDPTGLSPTSDPGRILESINGAMTALRKCEYGMILIFV